MLSRSAAHAQVLAAVAAILISGAAAATQPSFVTFDGSPRAVSADGRTVVGSAQRQPFRWTADGGMRLLGYLPDGYDGFAEAVSADGSVVVGRNTIDIGGGRIRQRVFIWQDGLMSPLIDPDDPDGWGVEYVHHISADGGTVVGIGLPGFPPDAGNAYRWTADDGFLPIPGVSGHMASTAWGITPDGRFITGNASNGDGTSKAYRWSEQTGMEILYGPPGFTGVGGYRMSDDGSIVISSAYASGKGTRAYRWKDGLWEDLGDIDPGNPGSQMYAFAISADGRIVSGSDVDNDRAFVWIEDRGMLDLEDYLVSEHGVDLAGHTLFSVKGMTPDGRTFVGLGRDPNGTRIGWTATIPAPSAALPLGLGLLLVASRRRASVSCH